MAAADGRGPPAPHRHHPAAASRASGGQRRQGSPVATLLPQRPWRHRHARRRASPAVLSRTSRLRGWRCRRAKGASRGGSARQPKPRRSRNCRQVSANARPGCGQGSLPRLTLRRGPALAPPEGGWRFEASRRSSLAPRPPAESRAQKIRRAWFDTRTAEPCPPSASRMTQYCVAVSH